MTLTCLPPVPPPPPPPPPSSLSSESESSVVSSPSSSTAGSSVLSSVLSSSSSSSSIATSSSSPPSPWAARLDCVVSMLVRSECGRNFHTFDNRVLRATSAGCRPPPGRPSCFHQAAVLRWSRSPTPSDTRVDGPPALRATHAMTATSALPMWSPRAPRRPAGAT